MKQRVIVDTGPLVIVEIQESNTPDEFDAQVHEAFRSENVQQALQELGERFDSNRTYPHALKA